MREAASVVSLVEESNSRTEGEREGDLIFKRNNKRGREGRSR